MLTRRAWAGLPCLLVALVGCRHNTAEDLHSDLRKMLDEIPHVVADSAHAATVLAAYQRLGDVLIQSAKDRRERFERWRGLYRRYDTPRQALDSLVVEQDAAARRVRAEALVAREDVRTHTTEKEWKALAASRKQLSKLYKEVGS